MSAFDIAGAVVATPLAVLFAALVITAIKHDDREDVVMGVGSCAICLAWAAFCIARLCGATL